MGLMADKFYFHKRGIYTSNVREFFKFWKTKHKGQSLKDILANHSGAQKCAAALKKVGDVTSSLFVKHFYLTFLAALLLRDWEHVWAVNPIVGNIVGSNSDLIHGRNKQMALNTNKMMVEQPSTNRFLTIMGNLHVSNYMELMIEKYGYREVKFEDISPRLYSKK